MIVGRETFVNVREERRSGGRGRSKRRTASLANDFREIMVGRVYL